MSAAKWARGTVLKKGATAIGEIVSIDGPTLTRDPIEVTHLASPDSAREHIPSWTDAEVSFDVNLLVNDPTHRQFTTEMYDPLAVAAAYTIEWSDGATPWTFNAFCTSFEPTADFEDKLAATITLKITGKVTTPP
jgi:hypothetical protein